MIRVTDEIDGELLNRGYSYWSQVVILDGMAYVFAGHVDGHPRFFRVDLATGRVDRLGWLLQHEGTGEGWYFDAAGWVYFCDGPRLRHINPINGEERRVVLDISDTHPGCRLWQAHSSDNGETHSATVQQIVEQGAYPNIGTVVVRHGEQLYFPAEGTLDESIITADGAYLVMQENHDNRVVTLETGEIRMIRNADGAVAHCDTGSSTVIGECDQPDPGCAGLWDLTQPLTLTYRRVLMLTANMGHVSVRGGRCLLSGPTHLSLIALDGSGVVPILEHGMQGSGYDYQVHGNLSPCGRVAAYVSNVHGRMDLFLVEL